MSNKQTPLTKLSFIDQGVLFMLISTILGALNGAVAKFLTGYMDPLEIVFYRNLLGILIILFTLKKFSVSFDSSKIHLLFFRGLFGALAMVLFFILLLLYH